MLCLTPSLTVICDKSVALPAKNISCWSRRLVHLDVDVHSLIAEISNIKFKETK